MHLSLWGRAGLVALLLAAQPVLAAEPQDGAFTDLDPARCDMPAMTDTGTRWSCPGHDDLPVVLFDIGTNVAVSFGADADGEKAATQFLPLTNMPQPRIQWRLGAGDRPIAAIQRHYVMAQEASGEGAQALDEVLVVTQVKSGATCIIGFADGKAEDGEALARAVADKAGDFDCGQEPEKLGNFGLW